MSDIPSHPNTSVRRRNPHLYPPLASEGDQEMRREADQPEDKLHDKIIEYCNAQWPRWKYIHARMDRRSTIAVGCQDFTVFAPGRVLCIECKRVGCKLDKDQMIWRKELEMLGHTVHVVTTFEGFEAVVKGMNEREPI